MKTAYCTITARNVVFGGTCRSSSGMRRTLWLQGGRPMSHSGGNVVDIEDWRGAEQEKEPVCTVVPSFSKAAWRNRTTLCCSKLLMAGEAAATLSVVCVAAGLLIRILMG